MPSPLSDLAATLDELEPAAAMAEAARKALRQKETLALQEILMRVWLELSGRAQTGESSGLRVCTRLVFCD